VLAQVLPVLRPGAAIVSYSVLDDAPMPVRNSDLIYRILTWKGFGIDHWLAMRSQRRAPMTAELWALLREGAVELPVAAVYGLDQIDRECAPLRRRHPAPR